MGRAARRWWMTVKVIHPGSAKKAPENGFTQFSVLRAAQVQPHRREFAVHPADGPL
jgi:hypothetical protein